MKPDPWGTSETFRVMISSKSVAHPQQNVFQFLGINLCETGYYFKPSMERSRGVKSTEKSNLNTIQILCQKCYSIKSLEYEAK